MKDRNKGYVGIFLLLVALVLGIWQWNTRATNQLQVNVLSTQANNLSFEESRLTEEYQALKADVSANREAVAQQIELVFPTSEDLTNVTRLFDNFEVKNNFASNPFFISSISYLGVSDEDRFRVLPMNVKVITSKKNLLKFFEFIETSGSLESEIRLMSIEAVTIRYPDEFGGTYNVDLTIFAYFSREI